MAFRPVRAAVGLIFLLLGLTGLTAVLVALYAPTPTTDAWSLRLGLAGGALASAATQVLTLVGGALIWSCRRRR